MTRISAILRADFGGLSTLSREFHDLFHFHRTLSLAFRPERHDDKFFCADQNRIVTRGQQISQEDAAWLIDGADAVLSFETFYSAEVPIAARKRGIKVCLVPMHEQTPQGSIANSFVDLVICPHELCRREMEATAGLRAHKMTLPVPFDMERVTFRRRERAKTFLHFAHFDRNGTHETIEAWQHVKSDARLIVNCLTDMPEQPQDERIEVRRPGYVDYWEGWDEADVLLLPHRFAGLCLPMQHALSAGMPIVTTAFWPFTNYTGFPNAIGPIEQGLLARYFPDGDGLLPPSSQALAIQPTTMRRVVICRPAIAFETSPQAIAAAVDAVFDSDISATSEEGRAWAEERSFEKLRGQWIEEIAA